MDVNFVMVNIGCIIGLKNKPRLTHQGPDFFMGHNGYYFGRLKMLIFC